MRAITTVLILLFAFTTTAGDEFCGMRNAAFKAGEVVTMRVYYTTLGMYVGAGEAIFTTTLKNLMVKLLTIAPEREPRYSFFDNFFKVRDRYETYIDTSTMLPIKFVRNVDEGGSKIYNNVTFNHKAGTAVSTNGVYKITPCIQDVISAIYYARNIDFNKYKPGIKSLLTCSSMMKYITCTCAMKGKKHIKTKYGKFRAIKFKPLLIKGTIFEGGEKMNVWVSDDANHLLLRVESPIAVGTIKVDMMGYRNLRYPLTSLVSFR